MWTRKDIKKQARQTIRRSYWRIIAVILIVACVNGDIRLNVMDSLARADGLTVTASFPIRSRMIR